MRSSGGDRASESCLPPKKRELLHSADSRDGSPPGLPPPRPPAPASARDRPPADRSAEGLAWLGGAGYSPPVLLSGDGYGDGGPIGKQQQQPGLYSCSPSPIDYSPGAGSAAARTYVAGASAPPLVAVYSASPLAHGAVSYPPGMQYPPVQYIGGVPFATAAAYPSQAFLHPSLVAAAAAAAARPGSLDSYSAMLAGLGGSQQQQQHHGAGQAYGNPPPQAVLSFLASPAAAYGPPRGMPSPGMPPPVHPAMLSPAPAAPRYSEAAYRGAGHAAHRSPSPQPAERLGANERVAGDRHGGGGGGAGERLAMNERGMGERHGSGGERHGGDGERYGGGGVDRLAMNERAAGERHGGSERHGGGGDRHGRDGRERHGGGGGGEPPARDREAANGGAAAWRDAAQYGGSPELLMELAAGERRSPLASQVPGRNPRCSVLQSLDAGARRSSTPDPDGAARPHRLAHPSPDGATQRRAPLPQPHHGAGHPYGAGRPSPPSRGASEQAPGARDPRLAYHDGHGRAAGQHQPPEFSGREQATRPEPAFDHRHLADRRHHQHHHQQQQHHHHGHAAFPSPAPSPAPSPPPPLPPHFTRGSVIALAGGGLKRVEELRTEDFVCSAEACGELRVDSSTLAAIQPAGQPHCNLLHFSVGPQRLQVTVQVSAEHPFFVFGRGWASCAPERTERAAGLRCSRLRVGDACVSLALRSEPTGLAAGAEEPRRPRARTWRTREDGASPPAGAGAARDRQGEPAGAGDCERRGGGGGAAFGSRPSRKRRWSAPDVRDPAPSEEGAPRSPASASPCQPPPAFIPHRLKVSIEGRSNTGL